MLKKMLGAYLIPLVFLIYIVVVSSGLRSLDQKIWEGTYFIWEGKLERMTPKGYETLWQSRQELRVIKYMERGTTFNITAEIRVSYRNVRGSYIERVKSVNLTVEREFDIAEAFYEIYDVNWGFYINFPISIFTLYNVFKGDTFTSEIKELYLDGGILEEKPREKVYGGLYFETWDIVLGSYRDVYYLELYYKAALFNINESSDKLTNSSVLEVDVTIDRSLGYIVKLRMFWLYENLFHQMSFQLVETNAFTKNTVYMILGMGILATVIIFMVVRWYRSKRRKRLIEI